MGRSQETFQKKDVRNKKEKKRKEKEKKRLERKETEKKSSFDDMIAYVDENGMLTSTPPDPNKKKNVKLKDIEIGISRKENQVIDPVRTGIVSYFNESKGYGFIKDSETKETSFVHVKNLTDSISEGNKVNFEIEKTPKGLTAIKVTLAK